MLDSFGEIVIQVDELGYQGDSFVVYQDGDRYGFLSFGWGSCSGCDALKACNDTDEIQELMDKLRGSIRWFDSAKAAVDWFIHFDWAGQHEFHTDIWEEFEEQVNKYFNIAEGGE